MRISSIPFLGFLRISMKPRLDGDEVLISFDVKSLYTNVPVDEFIAGNSNIGF